MFSTEKEFVEKIGSIAKVVGKRTGYLPSVLVAQTIQETGYGKTDLTEKNNIIGMKAALLNETWSEHSVWNGEIYRKKTIEFTEEGKKYDKYDNFRVYADFEQCLMDYCMFMMWARYSKNGKYKYRDLLGTKDPRTLITQVAGRGYCTDPGYPKSIMSHIEKWDLTKYDEVDTMSETITIIDLTSQNRAPKMGNTREALAFHFLGVAGADNPNLFSRGGTYGYGGQWYVYRDGRIVHAVKDGAIVYAVGKGSFKLKTDRWKNANTESVEMGCEQDSNGKWWFHNATQESAVKLARYWLEMRGYGVSEKTVNERILVHNDITTKQCPAPWLGDAGYSSPKESGHKNWSVAEFRRKIWEGYKGPTKAVFTGGSGSSGASSGSTKNYLSKGDKGEAVKVMQEMLIALGYDLGKWGADGKWGDTTETAVRAFQSANGLVVDGKYGNKSKTALESAYKALTKEPEFEPFMVRIKVATLHIRKEPTKSSESQGYIPPGSYTIVEVKEGPDSKNGWGRLKSGAGWISLDWAEKI